MLKLYNTLTRKVEEFKPLKPALVTYYSCGPTVYDFAHLGHARTYVFADILERVLKFDGYDVKRVMNITDVGHLTSDADLGEDKMEKGAKKEGKSVWDIAKFYTADFFRMCARLNINKPEFIPFATKYIDEMIGLIKILKQKGFTYHISDGIYFDTSKFPSYGQLIGQTFIQLQEKLKGGARVELVGGKKNITDFALWKFSYPHGRPFDPAKDDSAQRRQMEWDSPWGRGFPGWHIECNAMAMKLLGPTIDIHTGGVDHIPIHHTNEIAQGEAATGEQFVRYWLHAQHLLVDGEKMSKSLGNFYRLDDVSVRGFDPLSLRYLFLTAHYRSLMNFTWKSLEGAANALKNLRDQLSVLGDQTGKRERIHLSPEKLVKVEMYRQKFSESVNNDLNIPSSIAVLFEVLKSNIPAEDKTDLVRSMDEVLGLNLTNYGLRSTNRTQEMSQAIKELIKKREQFRKDKKWIEADQIRQELQSMGFEIKDGQDGSRVIKK